MIDELMTQFGLGMVFFFSWVCARLICDDKRHDVIIIPKKDKRLDDVMSAGLDTYPEGVARLPDMAEPPLIRSRTTEDYCHQPPLQHALRLHP